MKSLMVVTALCILTVLSGVAVAQQAETKVAQLDIHAVESGLSGSLASTLVSKLSAGLMAIRGGMGAHVKPSYTMRLANEAKEVIAEPGNEWMQHHILLGIAVSESDLRWWLKAGYGDRADCGLTQINITGLSLSYRSKSILCRKLTRDTKLSMQWTMKELNTIKQKYCNAAWLARLKSYHQWTHLRGASDDTHFWRCVLNVYNQGPSFLWPRKNTCDYKYTNREQISPEFQAGIKRRCESRNRYWLRTMCFAEGIRLGKPPKYSRRRMTRAGWETTYHRASCRRIWKHTQITGLYDY